MLGTVLLIILILILIGSLPTWPYSGGFSIAANVKPRSDL
jgi:hypothetical protein